MIEQSFTQTDHDTAQFDALLRSDSEIEDRYSIAAELVSQLAAERYGVPIAKQDLAKHVGLFRAAVISGQMDILDTESFTAELERHPVVVAALEATATKEKIESGKPSDELDALNRLPRYARIAEARRLGLEGGAIEGPAEVSERTHLRRIASLSPQQRINYARKYNLP